MIEIGDVKERGPKRRRQAREFWRHPTGSPLQQRLQWANAVTLNKSILHLMPPCWSGTLEEVLSVVPPETSYLV